MHYQNIFLLLGSNLGDRVSNLSKCTKLIELQIGVVINRSAIYETAPWGRANQPNFLNQALQVDSNLPPNKLLSTCLAIEKNLGRIRDETWAERIIDIDIIYFDNKIIDTDELKVPHPRMAERKFVLTPLAEISPEFLHPILKKTNRELLNECLDLLAVTVFQL